MNAEDYLLGTMYYTRLNFSNSSHFFDYFIKDRLKKVPFKKKAVISFLNKEIKRLSRKRLLINQKEAFNILITRDLKKLKDSVLANKIEDPEPKLPEAHKFFIKELKKLGLKAALHELFIVDKFPSIWRGHEKHYAAVGLGPGYKKFYNIIPGNYLLRRKLTPIFSEGMLLPHEITHQVINYYSDTESGRGFEEGICELFGLCFLGAKLIGYKPIKNRFIYSYLRTNIHPTQENYYLFFRQAAYIYLNYGLKGIITLIRKGRRGICEAEQYLEAGQFDKIKLPKGHWDKKLIDLVNHITLTYEPQLVVSPLARYIADFIKVGDDLEELRTRLNIDKKQFKEAIKELGNGVDVIQYHKNKVNYSVLPYILKAEALRYKIPK